MSQETAEATAQDVPTRIHFFTFFNVSVYNFYPPSTMLKGDIETVSVRPSEKEVLSQPQFVTDPY